MSDIRATLPVVGSQVVLETSMPVHIEATILAITPHGVIFKVNPESAIVLDDPGVAGVSREIVQDAGIEPAENVVWVGAAHLDRVITKILD